MSTTQQTLRNSITDSIWSILSLSIPDRSFCHDQYQLTTINDIIYSQKTKSQDRTISTPLIRSNEPSTIISHTLSALQCCCNQNNISYESIDSVPQLMQIINQNLTHREGEQSKYSPNFQKNHCKSHKETLKFEFPDKTCENSNSSFRCYLYHPVHFHKLRQQLYGEEYGECTDIIETEFIQSLSRCCECDSSAGKKGVFCKTLDDKYLLKFIKPNEFKMFLENFSSYYDHMSYTLYNKMKSLLIPIIGAYGISYAESKTHKSESMRYVLVMPNLFYSKNKNKLKKFDLKGTANTNRYNDKHDVKLDKNYIEYIRDSPVVLNRPSIRYLRDAIDNDTQFLAESNIMDYSLLIGIDSETNQIIGGIIDYLETYSWKKKAENSFKSLFRTDPTIQKPSIYKQRFQQSILNKYFVSIQC